MKFTVGKFYTGHTLVPVQPENNTDDCGLFVHIFMEAYTTWDEFNEKDAADLGSIDVKIRDAASRRIRSRLFENIKEEMSRGMYLFLNEHM